jgi:hypothetical protein
MKIGVGLEELLETVLFWLEFAVLILKHSNGSAGMDDEHLR